MWRRNRARDHGRGWINAGHECCRLTIRGMTVIPARIRPDSHTQVINTLRTAARSTGRRIAVMADLPGPKIRIGRLAHEPVELQPGSPITLTTRDIVGDAERVSVSLMSLPRVLKPGDTLFLNDGIIQLLTLKIEGEEVLCRVVIGGELRSHKGLNLPA